MTLRNFAASLALAAGSVLFAAAPALNAQDYGYNRPDGYGGYQRYDRDDRWERGRQDRYAREVSKLQRDREELNRALYRHDYRAVRREEREIAERQRRLDREFGRQAYGREDRRWNR